MHLIVFLRPLGLRLVGSGLRDLNALGWVLVVARRGRGFKFRVVNPPAVLTTKAVGFYGAKIAKLQAA